MYSYDDDCKCNDLFLVEAHHHPIKAAEFSRWIYFLIQRVDSGRRTPTSFRYFFLLNCKSNTGNRLPFIRTTINSIEHLNVFISEMFSLLSAAIRLVIPFFLEFGSFVVDYFQPSTLFLALVFSQRVKKYMVFC